jgi:glycosyltransferase involved in cell wall biosynthesis
MEAEIKRSAHDSLGQRAHFVGRVAREHMYRYYSAADLFVFPGIGESLGMVYLEAQACGLPVVALDNPGTSQVVRHGQTGLLVPRDDGTSLAEAVRTLLDDPDERARLAANAPRFIADRHDLARISQLLAARLESVFRSST